MKLSHEQVETIRKYVDQSAVNIESLRDDVLDHLCCVVEIKTDRGNVFEHAFQQALEGTT